MSLMASVVFFLFALSIEALRKKDKNKKEEKR